MNGLCLPVSYSGSGVAYPGLATVIYVFVPDNSQGTTKVLHALCCEFSRPDSINVVKVQERSIPVPSTNSFTQTATCQVCFSRLSPGQQDKDGCDQDSLFVVFKIVTSQSYTDILQQ
jgi:hypothetical protein